MWRVQVKKKKKTPSKLDYTVPTPIIKSHAVFTGGKTHQHGVHGEITPGETLLGHFVKADRTVCHLPSSKLHREVNSQRFCYFHEPFNVASKDIHIIYHSETSQKTPFAESFLKNPVYFLFFPPLFEAKEIQINRFF